jgi:hypothetical protein
MALAEKPGPAVHQTADIYYIQGPANMEDDQ